MPDLFDFFKENESKLHERPPEQVWEKLEKRLDKTRRQRGRQRRGIRFLQLGAVALVLLILLLAAIMVWYYLRQAGR